jgi:RHS repeat-associated protein
MLGNRVDEIVADYATANGQWLFHSSDGRGHCMLLTSWNGAIAEQYEYDAFGQPYFFNASGTEFTSSQLKNRFLFTGREYLSELKLYDYRARLYQPELGRFMQARPERVFGR